jgi:hypothetical protein
VLQIYEFIFNFWEGDSIFYNKILQQLLQEFPLLNWTAAAGKKVNVGGIGIRNIQNIFRKIYINNSENNHKLSYTPQPPNSPLLPGPS